jgi:hypothetical protein
MGGSKASAVWYLVGQNLLKCGCNEVMKFWVSNTDENPKRKFWRCRNFWEVSILKSDLKVSGRKNSKKYIIM